ncbi:MAG TPA: bifunctional DNA-binding transcriptional regulator/O6-methylguanine-DNA methyltransferase Ada [Rhizomicrobium sp.]|jgi:AraC family transcriptional regulator of adaptative response/methylated-DNA-[protein]-cysteine methyltransferase|nr:bifunctional DNA-binding transcriptional regulator/O6-methylguanine-DNA methyltransferase Ada [Rhizomicrobium sp.]
MYANVTEMATDRTTSGKTPNDATYLDAVRRRDRVFDGLFVYAVRTTGVYCKPSCASRPARPENLSFHATPAAAEAAGFRPCKRCRPSEQSTDAHRSAVERACKMIRASEEPLPLARLAKAVGMSPFHFHRIFRKATGVTPKAFAAANRAERTGRKLRTAPTVTEAIYAAGFSSASRFYEDAKARLGMTPGQLRRGGDGVTIRFAIGTCSLGSILVAASDRGICAISLGDHPGALLRDLQDRFPRAELVGGDPGFEKTVAHILGFVENPRRGLDLPLDIRGTAFQQRVWEALRAIPAGSTASYAEIAAAIGKPSAHRAVAGACSRNPLAVAIPCHRVVRKDGDTSGYRWGVERKRELLSREAQ